MSASKWNGAAGIARTATASAVSAPTIWPLYESANAEGTPIVVRRHNPFSRVPLGVDTYGYEWAWSFNNIQPTIETLGYLLWLFLGDDSWAANVHTLTLDDAGSSEYACISLDRVVDLGTSTPTQQIVGAKIGTLTLEIPEKGYANLAVSGLAADMGALAAALSPVIDTGADYAPLSWASFQSGASGKIQIGYNGGAVANDGSVKMLKLELTQPLEEGGVNQGSNQPTAIHEGQMSGTIEIEREFSGTGGTNAYDAWAGAQELELDALGNVGTHSARLQVKNSIPTAPLGGEVGVGAETIRQSQTYEIFQDASDETCTFTVTDAFGSAYN